MAPVILVTLQINVLAIEEVKINVGALPLQTVLAFEEVITGLGLTVTLKLAGGPTQPDVLVSETVIETGEIVLKSIFILSFAALATVAPVTVHV